LRVAMACASVSAAWDFSVNLLKSITYRSGDDRLLQLRGGAALLGRPRFVFC